MKLASLSAAALLAVPMAQADTPPFDRPGIAFSTQTLPAGHLDWEQGLPDEVRSSDDQGTHSTLDSATTRIRVGLTSHLELQVATTLYNRLQSRDAGTTSVDHGPGDVTLAFKRAMPPPSDRISWALLSAVELNTGKAPFANDRPRYLLAASASMHLDDTHATGLYAGVARSGRYNTYTLSPNFGFSLGAHLGGYVEAGCTFGQHTDKDVVAGGGLAWMAAETVQLDMYVLRGLTARSTDLQAGLGVSIYFP